ncbi:MAG: DUF1573 domain-containing protein [Desulfatiglans sp.]|nr:DUF1573 domain-containing protein [Thermodesulfobacteriota bacterium]MEE4352465.1 DUF1573 domain-containing protein [Desulfatiglans sp.]
MRITGMILCMLLATTTWAAQETVQETPKNAPKIEIESPIHDFKRINQGKVLNHDFTVFNRGTAPLEIKNVRPG